MASGGGIKITKLSIMIRRLLEALHLIKPQKPRLQKTDVSGSASRNINPYKLYYWRSGWSESKTRKNNTKYWEWEIKYNGFKLP